MSICNRVRIIVLGSVLFVGFFSFHVFSTILFENGQIGILLSIPIGIAFGALICWYIAETHDLKTWRPKDPNWELSKGRYIQWGAAAGIIIGGAAARFLGLFARSFIFETLGIGLLIMFGFIMFHSCRSENKSKTNQE
jgi:hypothetical protein